MVCVKVERHKGDNPNAEVQYVDQPFCSAVVVPRPEGTLVSVGVRIGHRRLPYEIVHKALDPKTNFRQFTCYADAGSLMLVPRPPFPDAAVLVETTDG